MNECKDLVSPRNNPMKRIADDAGLNVNGSSARARTLFGQEMFLLCVSCRQSISETSVRHEMPIA